jgi:hypothetical protein
MAGYGRTLTGTETEAMRCLAALDALSGPLWGTSSHEHEVTSPARMTFDPAPRDSLTSEPPRAVGRRPSDGLSMRSGAPTLRAA